MHSDVFGTRRPWQRIHITNGTFRLVSEPKHPKARLLYDRWREQHHGTGDLPTRDAFHFEELGAHGLLGHVFILEPLDGGHDWRFRLLGSKILWMFGRDVTNVPLRTAYSFEEAEYRIKLSNWVADEQIPLFLEGQHESGDDKSEIEVQALPVKSRDHTAIWLIGTAFAAT